jgi:hypothetical protein
MTCRDFERFWSTRSPDGLSPAVRAHLSGCPACTALSQADTATDAFLRRVRASRPPVDAHLAWNAIERTLEEHSLRGRVPTPWVENGWRGLKYPRSRVPTQWVALLTAAGLAAAAVAAAVIGRIPRSAPTPAPPSVATTPGQHPGQTFPLPEPEMPSGSGHGMAPALKIAGAAPFAGLRTGAPHLPPNAITGAVRTPPAVPQRPDSSALGSPAKAPAVQPHSAALPPHRVRATTPEGPALPQALGPGSRNQPVAEAPGGADLLRLNDGRLADAPPFSPPLPPPSLPQPLPLVETRKPGSLLLDDLLNLNPVRIAAVGDAGVAAAAQTLATEAPATDARLQQKVFVHASSGTLSDLLSWLTKATGVTLVPRIEVADESIIVWAEDRTLMDVMRDLRHLRGYYWSRSKQGGQYCYSLWQDAQSRAQEEAEIQRLALEEQRKFQDSIWKHVKALNASEAELKRLAQEDPYMVAQLLHPVVRGGYQLFATLSPDQQARLVQGQTPSRASNAGGVMELFPLETRPGDQFWNPSEYVTQFDPLGDVVTLTWEEMTPAQRAVADALLKGAAAQAERDARERARQGLPPARTAHALSVAKAVASADRDSVKVDLFRWGGPDAQGLNLRVQFQSGGRGWGLSSTIAVPSIWASINNDWLRQGRFARSWPWPGAQAMMDKYLHPTPAKEGHAAPPAPGPLPGSREADPILDAPVSFTWPLAARGGEYKLNGGEVLSALSDEIRHPLVLDGLPRWIEERADKPAEFRWAGRPVRELLRQLFPECECHTHGGAIFLRNPDRLRWRLNQAPPAVEQFLKDRQTPFTLDDMALLARSLSPWQVVKLGLGRFLPAPAIDQILAVQELLKLYGELAPAQRSALLRGIAFTSLTPPQQALFLQFAQRQRPFVEPWRFQNGSLRVTVQPAPIPRSDPSAPPQPVATVLFQVAFQADDAQSFSLQLFSPPQRVMDDTPLSRLVGKKFDFPSPLDAQNNGPTAAAPVLAETRLRKKALVIIFARPFAEPFVRAKPPPTTAASARTLAERLQDTPITVVHTLISARDLLPEPGAGPPLPNLLYRWEPGDINGQPLLGEWRWAIHQSPTVFVVGSDEIVQAVFEGHDAWDLAAVDRAARRLAPGAPAPQVGARLPSGWTNRVPIIKPRPGAHLTSPPAPPPDPPG